MHSKDFRVLYLDGSVCDLLEKIVWAEKYTRLDLPRKALRCQTVYDAGLPATETEL